MPEHVANKNDHLLRLAKEHNIPLKKLKDANPSLRRDPNLLFKGDDWGPGDTMAVTLDTGVGDRLEYPIGTPLYELPGPIHQIRVSPDGELVAFQEFVRGKSAIAVVDRKKQKRTLVDALLELNGLAWTADGNEVWFGGNVDGSGWE